MELITLPQPGPATSATYVQQGITIYKTNYNSFRRSRIWQQSWFLLVWSEISRKEVIIIILVPLGFRLCGMIFSAATTATIAQVKIMTQMTSHKIRLAATWKQNENNNCNWTVSQGTVCSFTVPFKVGVHMDDTESIGELSDQTVVLSRLMITLSHQILVQECTIQTKFECYSWKLCVVSSDRNSWTLAVPLHTSPPATSANEYCISRFWACSLFARCLLLFNFFFFCTLS